MNHNNDNSSGSRISEMVERHEMKQVWHGWWFSLGHSQGVHILNQGKLTNFKSLSRY